MKKAERAVLKKERGRPVGTNSAGLEIDKVVKAIEDNAGIVFLHDIAAFMGVAPSTIYRNYPSGSEEFLRIEEALHKNKSLIKFQLRKKWFASNNPTTDIALYRLLADEVERKALDNCRGVVEAKQTEKEQEIKLTL